MCLVDAAALVPHTPNSDTSAPNILRDWSHLTPRGPGKQGELSFESTVRRQQTPPVTSTHHKRRGKSGNSVFVFLCPGVGGYTHCILPRGFSLHNLGIGIGCFGTSCASDL